MFHFLLGPESVLGMPRIEINFVVVFFFCFLFFFVVVVVVVFPLGFTFNTLRDLYKVIVL